MCTQKLIRKVNLKFWAALVPGSYGIAT